MTSSSRNPIEQTRGGVSEIHMRLWSYVERKLPHHNTQSLMACFHFQLAFHCWDNRKESLGQPLQAGDRAGLRHCSRKDSWRKNAGSDLGVNFSQGFLLKEVFFPAKNSGCFFFFLSRLLLSSLASAEHSKNISFPFLPSGMLRRCDLWIGICFSWPTFPAKFMTHASASSSWLDTAREMEKASARQASKNELHLNDVLLFCRKKEHLACTVGKKNKMQHS